MTAVRQPTIGIGTTPAMGNGKIEPLILFGGERGWHSKDWTASDDRVRGGKSQSYLDCSDKVARFYGTLDIKTLGGAGFASQRTTGDEREWDLSKYAGIQLRIIKGDKKRYTFTIKDELLPPNPDNGREQSTVSWEVDFELPPQTTPGETHDRNIFVPWNALNPTYRGKIKKDADPLKLNKIRRVSLMMRSFFGTQEGDFSLTVGSIVALPSAPKPSDPDSCRTAITASQLEKGLLPSQAHEHDFYHRLCHSRSVQVVSALVLIALAYYSTIGFARC